MRFIKYIFIFLALVAGATFIVAPQFKDYHEGNLKKNAIQALNNNDEKLYKNIEVQMNKLHADRVVVTCLKNEKDNVDDIKTHVASLISKVPGAYTETQYIHVEFDDTNPDKVKLQNNKVTNQKSGNDKSKPKTIVEKKKPKLQLESSSVHVAWNNSKGQITVDGKMSNKILRNELLEYIQSFFRKSEVIDNIFVSRERVANQVKLKYLKNLTPTIMRNSYGAGNINALDRPGKLEIKATIYKKETYELILEEVEKFTDDTFEFKDSMTYLPQFSIEKSDKDKLVVLKGYAEKLDSVDLSSYVKKYTGKKSNNFSFKSEIIQDPKSAEYLLTTADQTFLSNHLERCTDTKIYFANDYIEKITGVTNNTDHFKFLKNKFDNTATDISDMTFNKDAKPSLTEKQVTTAQNTKSTAEQAKFELREQLQTYKIYFASGAKQVDAKYDNLLAGIASVIKSSADKKSLIVIGGFADNTGSALQNENLSKERARSVQEKLVTLGVNKNRTLIEFFGSEKNTKDKHLSRRVEIRVR